MNPQVCLKLCAAQADVVVSSTTPDIDPQTAGTLNPKPCPHGVSLNLTLPPAPGFRA